MKKIMLVFGTRPEAIKMCPLVWELRGRQGVCARVCVSGQHREMLRGALAAFGVTPDEDLDLMREGQTLSDITRGVLTGLAPLLAREALDAVLVHGDTTTAFAAALACFYAGIPVGHVEAGLRTYDPYNPYPEEFNRRAIAAMAHWHFAPTEIAQKNLLREGIAPTRVFLTGNTVVDALRCTVRPDFSHPALTAAGGRRLILLTAHRRESHGAPLCGMLRAIRRAVEERPDIFVLYPVHKNPAAIRAAGEILSGCAQICLTDPLGVVEWHNLMARATLILTDSGGMQEEALALGIPALVLRERTERPEGVAAGGLRLGGVGERAVYESLTALLDDPAALASMRAAKNPYGDGYAARRIADALLQPI